MARTALVTGAYGFVGRYVARQMAAEGWRVVGVGHGSWTRAEWQRWGLAEWHEADVTLDTLVRYGGKPEVIMHCAGSGAVSFSLIQPYQDFSRTVVSATEVLEFIRLHVPAARMVYPSSAGVYGASERLPIVESQPLAPASPYGMHKLMAEEMCQSYARHFGLAVTVVRLFSVYGIGLRKQLLWDACTKISVGEKLFFGSGTEIRDWLHVSDAAKLLSIAAQHASADCTVVNGGSGQGVGVREILSELFAAFGSGDRPEFSGNARAGDPVNYLADISRACNWGWQPQIEWREGVHEYAQWYRGGAI
ncbi:MAG: NAD(P)-dependent oxidoreductase [Gallionella sp.]|nr:NAD(P)-dependent oxidoreductase [Gallionella sp.]